MFGDVVQLKLQKPAIEPDEGVPLTTLGKIELSLSKFCFFYLNYLRMWNMFRF
jgi:hypothetical protein